MPKFSTPYDALLRVRRIEEDRAKAALAEANVAARAAASRLQGRRDAYTAYVTGAVGGVGGGGRSHGETAVSGFLSAAAHGTALAQAINEAAAGVESADAARGVAVEATRVASMRTQGLERLVERARQARDQELLAADQRTAEESMAGAARRRERASDVERDSERGAARRRRERDSGQVQDAVRRRGERAEQVRREQGEA